MAYRLDRFTPALSAALVLGVLLACKKKEGEQDEAAPSAAPPVVSVAPEVPTPPPAPSAAVSVAPAGPKLGDVKRYPEKEKKGDEAAVKILEADVKVFNEADSKTQEVAILPKDLVVVRLSTLEDEGFTLVDFPSGVGQFSPGWVETKFLEAKGTSTTREEVLSQAKTASVATSAKPATSAAPSASASAAPAASAAPSASASAAPAASTSAAPTSSAAPSSSETEKTEKTEKKKKKKKKDEKKDE
jgi:hypothetical protein